MDSLYDLRDDPGSQSHGALLFPNTPLRSLASHTECCPGDKLTRYSVLRLSGWA